MDIQVWAMHMEFWVEIFDFESPDRYIAHVTLRVLGLTDGSDFPMFVFVFSVLEVSIPNI
jgi:hypothetical protein